jgi:predicted HAD superfamily Cof-like phosphohydrolase
MTTIAASSSTLDTSAPSAPGSLVEFALECVPEPRISSDQPVTSAERAAAIHDVVTTVRNGSPYLTENDRRELAAALLNGLPPRSRARELVSEFHTALGLPVNDTTRTLNKLRADLIREEAGELADAVEANDYLGMAKESADVLYVTYGTALTHGYDLDAAMEAVHESNMTKLVDGKPIMREDGKVLKGPNYRAPDLSHCVPEVSR